ncbi:MAG: sugar isomerase domain-containing protein [Armatimonadia bacterium]
MLAQRYLDRVRQMLEEIERTELPKIEQAGQMVADSLASGGAFFITQIGHGTMPELLHRGGGLVCLRGFHPTWNLPSDVAQCRKNRPRTEEVVAQDEMMRAAVKSSELRAGDCVLVGSVSGRTSSAVALSLALKEAGATVIALVALDYAREVSSAHPSGKLLNDVADLVIDMRVPYGDGSLDVEGLEAPALPLSGVSQATICWMVCGAVIDRMLEKGLTPGVYMSANREGGPEFNQKLTEQFNELGY